jgi:predicted anti-sigma-YlaC factor YlaD
MSEHGNGVSLKCEDVREVLFDYMSRELGPARSVLVREHLRRCESCQSAAAQMQSATELLQKASRDGDGAPLRLSDARRARVRRAVRHPVWYWISQHNVIVAVVAVILFLAALAVVLQHTTLWDEPDDDEGITVTIGNGPPESDTKEAPVPPRRKMRKP